jgi:hypothetical protein
MRWLDYFRCCGIKHNFGSLGKIKKHPNKNSYKVYMGNPRKALHILNWFHGNICVKKCYGQYEKERKWLIRRLESFHWGTALNNPSGHNHCRRSMIP